MAHSNDFPPSERYSRQNCYASINSYASPPGHNPSTDLRRDNLSPLSVTNSTYDSSPYAWGIESPPRQSVYSQQSSVVPSPQSTRLLLPPPRGAVAGAGPDLPRARSMPPSPRYGHSGFSAPSLGPSGLAGFTATPASSPALMAPRMGGPTTPNASPASSMSPMSPPRSNTQGCYSLSHGVTPLSSPLGERHDAGTRPISPSPPIVPHRPATYAPASPRRHLSHLGHKPLDNYLPHYGQAKSVSPTPHRTFEVNRQGYTALHLPPYLGTPNLLSTPHRIQPANYIGNVSPGNMQTIVQDLRDWTKENPHHGGCQYTGLGATFRDPGKAKKWKEAMMNQ